MSDSTSFLGQPLRQSEDVSQVHFHKCESAAENLSSEIHKSRGSYNERETSHSQDNFIHEPEEQSALLDSALYLHILSPESGKTMTTRAAERTEENKVKSLNEEIRTTIRLPANDGSDLIMTVNREEKMNPDLTKNNYRTDADVLKAISCYTSDLNNRLTLNTAGSLQTTTFNQIKREPERDFHFNDNPVEYWTDEEDCRYPPQMSLSPPPGQSIFRKTTLPENKLEKKEKRRSETKTIKEIKPLENLPNTHLTKRQVMKTLSPISARPEQHEHQKISCLTETISPTVTPFLLKTASDASSTAKTSYQHNGNPQTTNKSYISSPSLIRPTLAKTVALPKENYLNSAHSVSLSRYSRIKDDKIFDSQRSTVPKRRVSRSKSSNVASTSSMFPEIPTISKTQGTSKSISDFRQSSSLFGKFVKKNSFKGALGEQGKGSGKQSQGIQQGSGSSRSKMGESTRRKIRRILSLN